MRKYKIEDTGSGCGFGERDWAFEATVSAPGKTTVKMDIFAVTSKFTTADLNAKRPTSADIKILCNKAISQASYYFKHHPTDKLDVLQNVPSFELGYDIDRKALRVNLLLTTDSPSSLTYIGTFRVS